MAKFGDYTPGASLLGAAIFLVKQAGATLRVTGEQLLDFFKENLALDDLTDVDVGGSPGPQDGDVLTYDASSPAGWRHAAPSGTNISVEDEGVEETAALVTLNFTGAGVTATDDGSGVVDVDIPGGGSGKWTGIWLTAANVVRPASAYGQLAARGTHAVVAFDDTTVESIFFPFILPYSYTGSGLTVDIHWTATATTGNVGWNVAVEADVAQDIDSDGFASDTTVAGVAVSGTSGVIVKSTATFASGAAMDSLAAGEPARLRISRDTSTSGDATGDAQIVSVFIRETP